MTKTTFKTKLLLSTAITAAALFAPVAKADIVINSSVGATQTADESDELLAVITGGNLSVAGVAFDAADQTGAGVQVETGNASTGIISTGGSSLALDFTDAASTISGIDVVSGIITSDSTTATVSIAGAADAYTIDVDSGAAITNTGAGGDVFVISGANGNQTVTVENDGNIAGTNNAGTVVFGLTDADGGSTIAVTNTGTINGGALGTAFDIGTGGNGLTITSNSGTITGDIVAAGTSTITITSNTGSIAGDVTTATGALAITQSGSGSITGNVSNTSTGDLDLTMSGSSNVGGNVSTTSADLDISLSGTSSITGNVNLGSNASSTLALNDTSSVGGNITLDDVAQTLTFNGGNVVGNVVANTNGDGDIAVTANTTLAATTDIGTNSNQVDDITISDGVTLNTDTNGSDIYADDIILNGATATLTIGSGAFDADVLGGADGQGIFNAFGGTLTAIGNIGTAANSLASIVIADGDAIDADTNDVQVHATAITLGTSTGSDATLTLGTGTTSGTIDGNAAGNGDLNFNGNISTNGNIGSTFSLDTITVATGVTVDAATNNNTISATTLTLAGTGALTTGTGLLTAATTFGAAGTLTLGTGGYSGTINGTTGSGSVIFNGNQTTGGIIGGASAATAVSLVRVNDGVTVTLDDNLRATTLTVGQGASGTLNQTAGAVNATNIGVAAGGAYNLDGGTAAGALTVATGGTFTMSVDNGFTGTLNGAGAGQGTVTFEDDYTSTAAIGTTALAAVNVESGATVTLGDALSATLTTLNGTGILNLSDTSRTVTGNLTTAGGGSTLIAGSGDHIVTGTLTMGAGDILEIDITGQATAGSVTAQTAANTNAGIILNVNLDSGTYIADNTQFVVIEGTAGGTVNDLTSDANQININGGTNASQFLTFTASVATNDLILTVDRAAYNTVAANTQQTSIANALDIIGAAGTDTAELEDLLGALDESASASAAASLLENATAQVDNSVQEVSLGAVDLAMNTFEGRLSDLRDGGMASGDEVAPANSVWVKAFGANSQYDGQSGLNGFDGQTVGVAVGGDTELDDNTVFGVGIAYSDSSADSDNSNKKTEAQSYNLMAYGSMELEDDMYLDGLVSGGINNYETSRIPLAGVTAKGDFDGQTYMARVAGGQRIDAGDGIEVVPNAGVTFAYTQFDKYTETGAGALNLSVDNDDINVLRPKVGVDVAFNAGDEDFKVRPELRLGYMYDALDTNQSTTSNFSGVATSFKTEAGEVNRSTFVVGAGVDLATVEDVTLSADYDYEINSDYSSHNGMLKVRYGF